MARKQASNLNLQISSSGTTAEQISWLMPRPSDINELIHEAKLCAQESNFTQVKFNYILISGFNDAKEDVQRLISLFSETPIIVKISSLNFTHASKRHKLMPGTFVRAREICDELRSNGIDSFVYGSFNETNVGCGQLAFTEQQEQGQ